MEHPEKALFDEVRGLRTILEESKERIAKVEKEYQARVVTLEKRCMIDESCHEKLESWRVLCKNRINFFLNEKVYTFYKSTIYNNIYPLSKTFLPEREDSIILETNKNFLKALIEIIRLGNEVFITESKKRNFETAIEKSIKENPNFSTFIKSCFEESIFLSICSDFGLNYSYYGAGSEEDLLESFKIEGAYTNMSKYEIKDVKKLADKNNSEGLFLNYNGEFVIRLSETIRTAKIIIKPFTTDPSSFSTSNGQTYAMIYSSLDGQKFDFLNNIPSFYGNNQNNNICDVYLQELTSFKYLKFKTNSSSLFSLSYIAFKSK
jgi:hypothetical protein